ncbi:MAG: hypothetical protein PHF10_03265 [Patescibacteria group bacterium]|nr:hypothetical protein [Patescibacteria group bacterium]
MAWKKINLILITFLLLAFVIAPTAKAGFGISPPYIDNENLGQGSHYEKKITLVRGDPVEDWKVEVITNVPKADDWITIDKGKEFIMPAGAQQVPIIFSIDVPKNAKFGEYKGSIRIKTSPVRAPEQGTVSILLGGQIDVNLTVAKDIFDFKIKGIKVSDLEEGYKAWWGYVPGIIKFSMQTENLGNIKAAPSKVKFEIYGEDRSNIVETIETSKIGKIEPFKTDWAVAELKTKLKAGSYWAQYKIFKKDEVVSSGEIHLSIMPKGTITTGQQNKIFDLNSKLLPIVGLAIIILIVIAGLILKKKKRK